MAPANLEVNDSFLLLGQPRRPWLDPARLKAGFLKLSASLHPDKVHHLEAADRQAAERRFADLNAAYQRLSNPKERLHHLLELELGAKPGHLHEMPAALTELAMECGPLLREADALIEERQRSTAALLKLQLLPRTQELEERLRAGRQRLVALEAGLEAELVRLDREWVESAAPESRKRLLEELELIYRRLSFYARWAAQMQERSVRLSF